ADASVVEGTGGTKMAAITASLSAPPKTAVTFEYSTTDGTAKAPGDYTFVSGTATIRPGETGTTVLVPVVGDGDVEDAETCQLLVSNVHGASLQGNGRTTVTITDDDACIPKLTYDFVEAQGCFEIDGDAYKSDGPIKLNGLDVVPNAGAEIVVDPTHHHIVS